MKEHLKAYLLSSLFNKKVKILLGPSGIGKKEFLFKHFIFELQNKNDNVRIFSFDEFNETKLMTALNVSKNNTIQSIFLISDIFDYQNYLSIINYVSDYQNIDIIATSNNAGILNNKNATVVRDRFEFITFPSVLFEDFKERYPLSSLNEYLFHNDINYSFINYSLKNMDSLERDMFYYSLECVKNGITYSGLQRYLSLRSSRGTSLYLTMINYARLANKRLFYRLKRINIKTGSTNVNSESIVAVDHRFYSKKTNQSDYLYKIMVSSIVSKMIYDGWDVMKAFYISQPNNANGERLYLKNIDSGFLIKKGSNRMLIFPIGEIDDIEIERIAKVPSPLLKVVITFTPLIERVDDNGIYYLSLEELLMKGVKPYVF